MEKTAKGAGFLKVTGILMIIGGAISLVLSIVAVAGIAALAYVTSGVASSGLLYASGALSLVSSVAELVAGIIGVKHCKTTEKAGVCIGWGVAVAVLCVAGVVLNALGGGEFSIVSLLLGLVLPVLYIIGAAKNK